MSFPLREPQTLFGQTSFLLAGVLGVFSVIAKRYEEKYGANLIVLEQQLRAELLALLKQEGQSNLTDHTVVQARVVLQVFQHVRQVAPREVAILN